jgi:chemotaxis protein CheC
VRPIDPQRDELDRLCELVNVGAGHAAGALAQLLGRPIRMSVPRVHRGEGLAGAPARLRPDTSGIFFEVEGGIGGVFAVLFPPRVRDALLAELLGEAQTESDQSESALREVGNILASHALSAVADLIGARVLPSLPTLALEAAGSVLASFQLRFDEPAIESRLVDPSGGLRGLLVWIPASAATDRAV